MANTFVFSASSKAAKKHLADTVDGGMSLDLILPHIDDRELTNRLRDAYGDQPARLWAGRSGGHDEIYWNKMEPGDLVTCYQGHRIIRSMFVVGKYKSASLALEAWPDESERPYDLIYFLTAPETVDLQVKDSPYFAKMYQGLRRLRTSDEIIKDFGTLEAFAQQHLAVGIQLNEQEQARPLSQGYVADAALRKAIEAYAVEWALREYGKEFTESEMKDTGSTCSWDIECKSNQDWVRVEVKGTRSVGEAVILTANEVEHVRNAPCRVDLFVVSDVKVEQGEAGDWAVSGGRVVVHQRGWVPDDNDLTPTQFRYDTTGLME